MNKTGGSIKKWKKSLPYMDLVVFLISMFALSGCESIVSGTMRTANQAYDAKEASRSKSIYESSVARYQAMKDAGNPKGYYYMAIVHAAKHANEMDTDASEVKKLYEEAIAKGSHDAKVALGVMLTRGDTMPYAYLNVGLPLSQRDPNRGLLLLKEAAEESCSFTEPLIAIDTCRERESSIPLVLQKVFAYGWGGLPADPKQEAYWKERREKCDPIIDEINRKHFCSK